jgi:predicted nucleotidyltransferase
MKFGLTDHQLERVTKTLSHFPAVDKVVIFGSRAMGKHKPSSDIDLALFGDGLSMDTVYALAHALDDLLLPVTFDLLIFDRMDNPDLIAHIQRTGKVFYEKHAEK